MGRYIKPHVAKKPRKTKSCATKFRHETEGGAFREMKRIIKERGDFNIAPKTVYKCGHCKGWHVGHKMGWTKGNWNATPTNKQIVGGVVDK